MAKIISISNQKGGVGKTSTTGALGACLQKRGYKVLLIDLDPQGNLSFSMGGDTELNATIFNVLKNEVKIQHAIQHTTSADILCSNILLSAVELEFTQKNREYILKKALAPVKDFYDFILIDTPPALSVLTINAFAASDSVIVPMLCDIFSLQGIAQLNDTIKNVKKYCNPNLKIEGVLLTRFNSRSILSKQIRATAELIAKDIDTHVFHTAIRNNISVSEAQASQLNPLTYSPRSTAMVDYMKFTQELLERCVQ